MTLSYLGICLCSIRKFGALHPGRLEPGHRVDGIEEAEESDALDGPAKGLAKPFHEAVHLALLGDALIRVIGAAGLPAGEGLPREHDHFLVAVRQEAHVVEHLGQEPRDVGASREAEEVDLVPGAVEPHQEPVAAHDVLVEGAAHGRVLHLEVPRSNARGCARVRERAGHDICANLQVCYELLVWSIGL